MKLFIEKGKLDEIILGFLEINIMNCQRENNVRFVYEYLISSDILEKKIKNILNLHGKGEFNKSYDLLLIQSDLSNPFYDIISNNLFYIEFLEYIKCFKYLEEINQASKINNYGLNDEYNKHYTNNDELDNNIEKFIKKS